MTQATPPGWHPDPGQTSDGPPTERWWDGKAWTDQTHPAGSGAAWGPPAEQQFDGGYPAYPAYPAPPPPGARRGLSTGIAVAVAAAVLASIGLGVYTLSGDDGGSSSATGSTSSPSAPSNPFGNGGSGGDGGSSPEPETSEPPRIESGSVTDAISGISIPIPDGWYGQTLSVGASVTSEDSYDCPGNTSSSCTKGGAYSAPALALGTAGSTAEEVAKADITANAEESYGGDSYGGITSHEVLSSKSVTVAGEQGYQVRWKAVTKTGADGYVESLAFPSPADSTQIVVIRIGVDVSEKQSMIDEITKGIEVSSGSGGGSGQDV